MANPKVREIATLLNVPTKAVWIRPSGSGEVAQDIDVDLDTLLKLQEIVGVPVRVVMRQPGACHGDDGYAALEWYKPA